MYLTTKLDRATSKNTGESVAPRLLPFLYRVKDYQGVLDTFAQSNVVRDDKDDAITIFT